MQYIIMKEKRKVSKVIIINNCESKMEREYKRESKIEKVKQRE